jgi:hypothetical protein
MNTRLPLRFLLFALALAAGGVPPAKQDISIDTARADASRGEHRAALQKIGMLLAPPNEPLPGDRYELLMLKAECQLQLKDRLGSASTFKSAAKAAGDAAQLAAARANALIVERSSAGTYTPAFAVGESPIDILKPDSRKLAMVRLQQELWSKNKRYLDQAMRADTLPPIERVFTIVAEAYCLELTTTGDAKQTGPAMRELGARAFGLMDADVARGARAIDGLTQLANSAQSYDRVGWSASPRGLVPAERNELGGIATYLTKIQARAREYREAAARLGGDPQKWDTLLAAVTDAVAQAEALAAQH